MGFPDENIQITSDLWITYEEKYIIVIQPEDSSLAPSQQPTEQRVRGEGHLPPLHCGRPEHGAEMKSLDCFMLLLFLHELMNTKYRSTEPGVSELQPFPLGPGLLEVILDDVTVLGLLLVRLLCKRF